MRVSDDDLATLFEGAPGFVRRLSQLEANGWHELLDRAETIAAQMPEDEQFELLNAHPRIGAQPSTLSVLSHAEQGYDLGPGSADLQARLDALNDAYERRFGFRFVIYVAGRPRSEIAAVIERRLDAPRDEERQRALADVFAIARSRLASLEQPLEEAR